MFCKKSMYLEMVTLVTEIFKGVCSANLELMGSYFGYKILSYNLRRDSLLSF